MVEALVECPRVDVNRKYEDGARQQSRKGIPEWVSYPPFTLAFRADKGTIASALVEAGVAVSEQTVQEVRAKQAKHACVARLGGKGLGICGSVATAGGGLS